MLIDSLISPTNITKSASDITLLLAAKTLECVVMKLTLYYLEYLDKAIPVLDKSSQSNSTFSCTSSRN